MTRIIVATGLALIPMALFGQEEKRLTPRELNDAFLADLRGPNDAVKQPVPDMRRPETWWPLFNSTMPPLPSPKPAAETVSVASLSHRVPKAARKAFDRAAGFASKRDTKRAVDELEKAVALDPEYAAAHSDLGVQYIQLRRMQEAEAEFRRAIALDEYISIPHSNLAWLLFQKANLPEAEQNARRAIALSPDNESAHLLLGIVLGAVPTTRADGIRHLEQASSKFPEVKQIVNALR